MSTNELKKDFFINPLNIMKDVKKKSKTKKANTKESLSKKAKLKIEGARFRFLNEKLYNSTSEDAFSFFQTNPDQFTIYHQGFRQQTLSWKEKPIDFFIEHLKSVKERSLKIADIGCGEALLSRRVMEYTKLHSFVNIDLFSLDKSVLVANMTELPLSDSSFDIAIFCLSLMNMDYEKALYEASRILKIRGEIWIAEIKSRLKNGMDEFCSLLKEIGFSITEIRTVSGDVFIMLKGCKISCKTKPEKIQYKGLKPCVYKKR